MFDYTKYKQDLWKEYNNLFNKYANWNDSYSVNARLLYMDIDNSNWDTVGGSVSYWDKYLNQLKWKIYENVPLFQNAPAVTQFNTRENTETFQNFTATLKFVVVPKPNDLLMFYDDKSETVYRITDVRFHRTIEDELKIFECDFETAPVQAETIYDLINVTEHLYYNSFNKKLYDFEEWIDKYQPILDNIHEIVKETNLYFDNKKERYIIKEFNEIIKDIKLSSTLGAVTKFMTPMTQCDDSCIELADANENAKLLYLKLIAVKEIT